MLFKNICFIYLIIISYWDIRVGLIPNLITLCFFILAFISDIILSPADLPVHLLSSIFFFGVFFTGATITKGIGAGDIKMASAIGYTLGFFKTAIVFTIACAIGIGFFSICHLYKKKMYRVPFAPFVLAGYSIAEVFGGGFF